MAKRRIQPSDEEIAQRARNLARQLTGRLFVSPDGVYLVRGRPEYRQLRECLTRVRKVPKPGQTPTPLDLGFPANQVDRLTPGKLATWGRGVQKWRRIFEDYRQPRQKTSQRRRKYQRWQEELPVLAHTLEFLWEMLRRWEEGQHVPGAPYVPDPVVGAPADDPLPEPLWVWLEGLITWLAGAAAGRRFRQSLLPFAESSAVFCRRSAFSRILPRLRLLADQADEDPEAAAAGFRQVLGAIPEELLQQFDIQLPLRSGDGGLPELLRVCEQAAEMAPPPRRLVAAAAGLCAADGGAVPLPRWLLTPCGEDEERYRRSMMDELYDQHDQPGYAALLKALPQLRRCSGYRLGTVQRFLAAGVSLEEAQWAVTAMPWAAGMLAVAGLRPGPFHTLVFALEAAGLQLDGRDVDENTVGDLVEKVVGRGSTNIVEAFAQWLAALNPEALNANLARWAWHCLQGLLILEGASPALRDILGQWAEPPADGAPDDPAVAGVPPAAQPWLTRLFYYQRLCGRQPAVPGSLAKLLDAEGREAGERDYLRQARDRGELTGRMAARLELIEDRNAETAPAAKIVRQAQEVCAHAALEAVRELARREGQRVWQQVIRVEPGEHLDDDEVTAIAAWATGLRDNGLGRLRELLQAWQEHGRGYRRQLAGNATWIDVAWRQIDLDAWLLPQPYTTEIDGLSVTIGAAADPFRVLLMGSYFGTCLSLDDCNRNSVLANAYEANKAVVFAIDADGRVLARKLVAIDSRQRLLAYRTYIAADDVLTEARREELGTLVDAWCGRWGRRVGLTPGFAGRPRQLTDLFWYNDGATAWGAAAMRVWMNPQASIQEVLTATGLLPPVAAALAEHEDACAELLAALGIELPATGLASAPGLAEETLAIVARERRDPALARIVYENATTRGGQLEGMAALAQLDGNEDLFDQIAGMGNRHRELANWAMAVLRAADSPAAWKRFMDLAFRGHWAPGLWLPIAVADSEASATALTEALFSKEEMYLATPSLLLASELLAAHGMPLSPAVVAGILVEDELAPGTRLALAQWLPCGPETLKRVGAAAGRQDAPSDEVAAMVATVLAMATPGPRATSLLRAAAKRDAAALLALAILSGARYRRFIRRRAVETASHPAAALALFVAEGEDAAAELLAPTVDGLPKQAERLDCVRDLWAAFHELDAGEPVDSFSRPGVTTLGPQVLPYILSWLWRWTAPDDPNVPALVALLASNEALDLLARQHVSLPGFAARLAHLLRQADGDEADCLRWAVERLVDSNRALRDDGIAVVLDKLSGYRLWIDPPAHSAVLRSIENGLDCGGIWEILLAEDSMPLPERHLLNWHHSSAIPLPLDSRQVIGALRFLSSLTTVENARASVIVFTDIQMRLVANCSVPAQR